MIGVLLTKGSAWEKSRVLFELYDPENNKVVNKSDIHRLIDDLLNISVSKLPSLVPESMVGDLSSFKKYLDHLEGNKDISKPFLVVRFLGTKNSEEKTIDQLTFQNNFEDDSVARLLSANGLREFVYKQRLFDIPKIDIEKDIKKDEIEKPDSQMNLNEKDISSSTSADLKEQAENQSSHQNQ